jgi:hypothetical protein
MTVHPSPQPTRRDPLVASVREREAGLPEPSALHRRLLAGFLTDGNPHEPVLARQPSGAPLTLGGVRWVPASRGIGR